MSSLCRLNMLRKLGMLEYYPKSRNTVFAEKTPRQNELLINEDKLRLLLPKGF